MTRLWQAVLHYLPVTNYLKAPNYVLMGLLVPLSGRGGGEMHVFTLDARINLKPMFS